MGEAARTTGGHFEINNRVMARFASIGLQEVIPSLQGSRLALENLLQPVLRLGTGFAGLALAGVGVAAAVGYGLYRAFQDTRVVWKDSAGDVLGVEAALKELNKEISTSVQLLHFFEDAREALTPPSGGIGLDLTGEFAAGLALAQGGADVLGQRVTALKAQEQLRRMERALGDFSEAGGLQAELAKTGALMAKNFLEMDKAMKVFETTAGHLAVTDPLLKMLTSDWQATQDLINNFQRLIDIGELAADLGGGLIGRAGAAGGQRQIALRQAFNFQQGVTAEAALGFGDTGILAGLDAIEKLNRDADIFRGNLVRMREAGVGWRDINNAIFDAQTKVDERIMDLNKRFAETPAILDLLRTKLTKLEFGQFARDLSAEADGLGEATTASISFTTALSPMPGQLNLVDASLVSVTGDVLALARAFAFAAQQALFLNASVGGEANLGPAPGATE